MFDFEPQPVVQILEANREHLGDTDASRNDVLAEAIARLRGRSPLDLKEASKIAVEASKLFITIAIAVLVAVGTFVQFARNGDVPWFSWVMAFFALAVVSLLASMTSGFIGISRIYKRAEGRIEASQSAWSTAAVKRFLDSQGILGIVSLVLLISGLIAWGATGTSLPGSIAIAIPGPSAGITPAGPLTIEGNWTSLTLKTAAGQQLILPSQSQPITLTCR
jgi:hypothetical protein